MKDERRVQLRNTRTGDARKIDEWRVRLPGGARVTFDVSMFYEDGTCLFLARTEDPTLADIRLQDADLNRLREDLDREVGLRVASTLSDGWVPASVLQVWHSLKERDATGGDLDFSLNLKIRRVESRLEPEPGNIPIVEVRDEHRHERVVLRGHAEDFSSMKPKSGSLLDPEVKAWLAHPVSRDQEAGMGRVVVPGSGSPETQLLEALDRFAEALSARLAPGRVDVEGLPEPEDLVEMMRLATQDPEKDPGSPGPF